MQKQITQDINTISDISEISFFHSSSESSNESIEQQSNSIAKKIFKFMSNTLGIQNLLAKAFIFHPPSPTYSINKNNQLIFLKSQTQVSYQSFRARNCDFIKTKAGILRFNSESKEQKVAYFYIKNQRSVDNSLIIYSHGNSSDIGNSCRFLIEMAIRHGINILTYDYRGYGCSEGKTIETNIYQDIEMVLSMAVLNLHYSMENIILWGFSLGSAPAVEMASKYPCLGGLILEAPLASVYVFLENEPQWHYQDPQGDMFENLYKIGKVKCQILIIHGKADSVIPYTHSQLLLEKYKNSNMIDYGKIRGIFIEDINHNEIKGLLQSSSSVTAGKFKEFIEATREINKKISTKLNKYYQKMKKIQKKLLNKDSQRSQIVQKTLIFDSKLEILLNEQAFQINGKIAQSPIQTPRVQYIEEFEQNVYDEMDNQQFVERSFTIQLKGCSDDIEQEEQKLKNENRKEILDSLIKEQHFDSVMQDKCFLHKSKFLKQHFLDSQSLIKVFEQIINFQENMQSQQLASQIMNDSLLESDQVKVGCSFLNFF